MEGKIETAYFESYEKEFAVLDFLYKKLDFSIYEDAVYNEAQFYTTVAWYIELLKEQYGPSGWEEQMQHLIDDIFRIEDEAERFKYLYYFFGNLKVKWYKSHGFEFNGDILEGVLNKRDLTDRMYSRRPIEDLFPGIVKKGIPQWYWIWFGGHDLERKVMNANRRSFIDSVRKSMNKEDHSDD
ncbi:MAG: hypothetical protein IKT00_06175 [Prevotella sp.]|nr:hypothetical protein [Prevotella sp.]